jgi:tetratricopeptide (TPR) repeat protein
MRRSSVAVGTTFRLTLILVMLPGAIEAVARQPGRGGPDENSKRAIERAAGMISDRFAFGQSLSFDEFSSLADRLRPAGYRPLRVRPYRTDHGLRVAAVWARDAVDWRLKIDARKEEVGTSDQTMRAQGFFPVDVARYVATTGNKAEDRYAIVWAKRASTETDAEVLIGLDTGPFNEAANRLSAAGFTMMTLQRAHSASGILESNSVWTRSEKGAGWAYRWGNRWYYEDESDKLTAEYCPADVATNPIILSDRISTLKTTVETQGRYLRDDPGDIRARNARGFARFWLGEDDDAIDDFNEVIRDDPAYLDGSAYYYRAIAQARRGRVKEAADDAQSYLEQGASHEQYLSLVAVVTCARGNCKNGAGLLTGALEADPKNITLEFEAAKALAMMAGHARASDLETAQRMTRQSVQLIESFLAIDARLFKFSDMVESYWPIHDSPEFVAMIRNHRLDQEYSGVWQSRTVFDSRVVHAATVSENLERARELAGQGFVPVAIAVAEIVPQFPAAAESVCRAGPCGSRAKGPAEAW